MTGPRVSVVIPTRKEESCVASAIRSAWRAGAAEVIVADARSADATVARAREAGATAVVQSLPGRGIQQNSGAMFATGEFLLFLHADSRLGEACLSQLAEAAAADWGGYRQRIESPRLVYRLIEHGNAWRVRLRRMPFGDQAIFVRRSLFKEIGGFPEIPLMEDVELSRRLRKRSRPRLLPGPVTTSPRRWEQRGVLRQTLRNWRIQLAHACGVPPDTLSRWYSSE